MLIACAIWALAICLMLYSSYLTWRHFQLNVAHGDTPPGLLPVTILKPLKGVDSGLEENLRSFFSLDYPEYELLFSIADGKDPAVAIVEKLIAQYPGVNAALSIGEVQVGINPKVNNLIQIYDRAQHDWVLISDSNVRVQKDYLKKMTSELKTGVGVVTSVVVGQTQGGLGGELEAMYLNTFYAKGMIFTASVGHSCVIGKSMLFQKSAAKRFGGLRTLGRYLAEDYMAGEAMKRLGLRTVIASHPVQQYLGKYSVREFWSRHLRWGRIRKAQAPVVFLIEPLLGCWVSGILGALAFKQLFHVPAHVFILFHLSLWALCDGWILKTLKVRLSRFGPLAWFLREALAVPLWIHIALGDTVNWRGRRLRLLPGGLVENLECRSPGDKTSAWASQWS